MKLETKYEINDCLNFLHQGKVTSGTVMEIRVEIKSRPITKAVANKKERINTGEYSQRGSFEYYILAVNGINKPITKRVDELFRTKEELIASLLCNPK